MQNLMLVAMMLVAVSACQLKTTIPPERYQRGGSSQQTVIQPAATTSTASVIEQDVADAAPKAAQAPTPTPAARPAAQRPVGGVAVREEVTYQIGAFSKEENARALSQKVQAAGFLVSVEEEGSFGAPSHRVMATWQGSDTEGRRRLQELGIHDPILIGGRVDPTAGGSAPASHATPAEPASYAAEDYATATAAASQSAAASLRYQVGTFSREENATHLRTRLENNGFQVSVEPTSGVTPQYRVIAAWSGSDEEARLRLREQGVLDPILLHGGVRTQASQASPAAAAQQYAAPATDHAAAVPQAQTQAQDSGEAALLRFQVGAFGSVENAETLSTRLQKGGYRTEIELVEEQGKARYRVLASKHGAAPTLTRELMDLGVANPILLGF